MKFIKKLRNKRHMKLMEKLKEQLIIHGLATEDEIVGCSPEEISELEKTLNLPKPLPQIYREFLLTFGHGAGFLFRGTDAFYNFLYPIQEAANDLMIEDQTEDEDEDEDENDQYDDDKKNEEKKLLTLPKNAFVFSMHQGYQFSYFLLDGDDDPYYYFYMEGCEGQASKSDVRLSKFLINSVDAHIEMYDDIYYDDLDQDDDDYNEEEDEVEDV